MPHPKKLRLKVPFFQSPMAGCTDLAFRLIAREHGLELAYTEMISSEALVREHHKTLALLRRSKDDFPTACQIVGHTATSMGRAAAIIESLGFDMLDINCGCPVRKITGQEAGAALLKDPKRAEAIIRNVLLSVKKIPVSVKMRIGYNDPTGAEAVRLAKIAEDAGISFVTVHGRTKTQGYSGKADWSAIAKIKKAVSIPVFGNGDVFAAEDAVRMMKETGCDGVAIGRGALGNPWLYGQIRDAFGKKTVRYPTIAERKRTVLKHLRLTEKFDGPRLGLLKSRHIAPWYFKGCHGASLLREKVHRGKSIGEIAQLIKDFEFSPSDPSPTSPSGGDCLG